LEKGQTNAMTRANSTLIGVTRTNDGHFKQVSLEIYGNLGKF
jgi:hypothetical protein